MKIKMLTTAANPGCVLRAGKVYDVPEAVAELYLAAEPPACTTQMTQDEERTAILVEGNPDSEDKGPKNPIPTLTGSKKK